MIFACYVAKWSMKFSGVVVRKQLFGARLWADSVGILTRSGTDIEQGPKEMLQNIVCGPARLDAI